MKKLTIQWQRLVNDRDETCPRCRETGETVASVVSKLERSLAGLGIEVELIQKALDFPEFSSDPLASNIILMNGKRLEEWIGGEAGASKCCDACGDARCRTLSFGEHTFEAVPENLILKAGLLAAAELMEE